MVKSSGFQNAVLLPFGKIGFVELCWNSDKVVENSVWPMSVMCTLYTMWAESII